MTNLAENMKEAAALYLILEVYLKPNGIIKRKFQLERLFR